MANRCVILASFTFREERHDRATVKREWAAFARQLKVRWPDLAWVRVLELHPSGHGYHVHAALNRAFPRERTSRQLARLWGHGFVDLRRIRAKGGGREDARTSARYIAKYIGKDLETAQAGEHAYEVAQGFQPIVQRIRSWERESARGEAIRAMGGEVPASEWDSRSAVDWRGPPVLVLSW